MALTLNINGKIIEEPSSDEIARSFEELSKMKSFSLELKMAVAILARDEAHQLIATGQREAGFVLSHRDGGVDSEYMIDSGGDVEFAEVVRIFQAYARGEDWGKETFTWERRAVAFRSSMLIRILLIVSVLSILAVAILRRFIAK